MFTIEQINDLHARLGSASTLPEYVAGGFDIVFDGVGEDSINAMRARHPAWFHEDLERLLGLLATHAIRPRVAERISFDEVADAHRRIEAGGRGQARVVPGPPIATRPGAASARVERHLHPGRARELKAAQRVYSFDEAQTLASALQPYP
jgi:NADPH2:quinone reductase